MTFCDQTIKEAPENQLENLVYQLLISGESYEDFYLKWGAEQQLHLETKPIILRFVSRYSC